MALKQAFGEGVKKSDVKDALELMTLASKVQLQVQDELTAAITIDRITNEYTANPKEYDLVDYLNYAFDVRYATVSKEVLAGIGEDAKEEDHKEEILNEYKKQIAEAIEKAEALSKITDKDEFIKAKGIEYKQSKTLDDVIGELDILYMTRVQQERFFNEEDYLRLRDTYILDEQKMKLAKDDMIVMHPLPRVNEISTAVDNDKRACYFRQAHFGRYVRMALILKLLGIKVD